jgi:hypothetical protein
MPFGWDLGLDDSLLAFRVNLEDSCTGLSDLGKIDMHGRAVGVDREANLEVKGRPVLGKALEVTLDGPCIVIRRSAGDGHGRQSRDELVIEPGGLASVEDVTDIKWAAAM